MSKMKPLDELVADATSDEGIDMDAVAKAMDAELEKVEGQRLTPGETIRAFNRAQADINQYIGMLVLAVADEIGALPNGFDDEWKNMQSAFKFMQMQAIYTEHAIRQLEADDVDAEVVGEAPPL